MDYTYKYPRPALTVDMAVFKKTQDKYKILLIKRKNDPFAGMWALPGGFVDMDETVEMAATRELFEETNLSNIQLEQFHVFSELDRDPRGRTVTVIFIGFLEEPKDVKASDDAEEACWFEINNLPDLAFDHIKIIQMIEEVRLNQS